MEHANPVATGNKDDNLKPIAPSHVGLSPLPDAESTRTKVTEKGALRSEVESTTSEVEKPKPAEIEEPIFSRNDEPEVKGTIVVTVFKNHPYEIEFSGVINGSERDLAIKFIMQKYMVWKNKLAKQHTDKIKKEQVKKED